MDIFQAGQSHFKNTGELNYDLVIHVVIMVQKNIQLAWGKKNGENLSTLNDYLMK